MFDKIMKKINYWTIIFVIIMMPGAFFLNNYIYDIFNIKLSIHFYQILHFIIPFEIFLYIYNLIKKNIKFNKYDVCMYLLIILGIITTINAVDVQTSIWGAYLRNEGLLSLISYYLIFLNAKSLDKEQIKKVIEFIFIVGIIQFIYSLLQVFIRGKYIFGSGFNAVGFIGHHNMMGSFYVLLLGLSLMMFFMYNKKKYLIYSIIFFINLVLAESSGPFFAFCAICIFITIFLIIKKIINWKKILSLLVIFVVIFIGVSFGSKKYCEIVFGDKIKNNDIILGDIMDTLSIVVESDSAETEEIIQYYGSNRFTIWKNTLKIVPKYFWTGAGIDNFGYVYPKSKYVYYGQTMYVYVDKAHNEYLQTLVTQGIFTLIIYLGLLLCLFIDGIKSNNKLVWILLVGFVGYAIQAFMNISITTVAPFYFMVLGMLAGIVTNEKHDEKV